MDGCERKYIYALPGTSISKKYTHKHRMDELYALSIFFKNTIQVIIILVIIFRAGLPCNIHTTTL